MAQVSVRAACSASLVTPLWKGSRQGHIRGGRFAEHQSGAQGGRNVCMGLLWEGTWSRGLARVVVSTEECRAK